MVERLSRPLAWCLAVGLAITLAGMKVYPRKFKTARARPVAETLPGLPPCPPKPLR